MKKLNAIYFHLKI